MRRRFHIWVLFVILAWNSSPAQGTEFFVSPGGYDGASGTRMAPFATIGRAKRAVRESLKKQPAGDVTVTVGGGEYAITEPLVFDALDSPDSIHSVTYRAESGSRPFLSGGRPVTGWSRLRGDVWKCSTRDTDGRVPVFRQLFRGGERLVRARYPDNDGLLTIADVTKDLKQIRLKEPLPWSALGSVRAEIVVLENWNITRVIVDSLAEGTLYLKDEAGWVGHCCTVAKPGMAAYIENSPELLSSPGEWYHDEKAGELYYVAGSGEDPNGELFTVPVLERLLILRGRPARPLRNIRFSGIGFEYCEFPLPAFGYRGVQAGYYGKSIEPAEEPEYAEPSALLMEYAVGCSIDRSRITHVGGAALGFGCGTARCRVSDSEIDDIGGNGVNIGQRTSPVRSLDEDWAGPEDVPSLDTVVNCYIHHCGATQLGDVGVFAAFCRRAAIVHNTVAHLPYTGISVGFRWNSERTSMEGCTVEANHVFDVMNVLADGGCIYTLGLQPGTVLRNNLLHDAHRSGYTFGGAPNNAVFFDEGTTALHVEGNVSYATSGEPLRFNQSRKEDQTWGVNYFGISPDTAGFPSAIASGAGSSLVKNPPNR
jgi:hypothetical protein